MMKHGGCNDHIIRFCLKFKVAKIPLQPIDFSIVDCGQAHHRAVQHRLTEIQEIGDEVLAKYLP